jgi:hypothetical protein
MRQYRLQQPPAALCTAKRDPIALVPANLLPFKTQWQHIANRLPTGSTLVILPSSPNRPRKMFEQVAAQLREAGKQVKTLSAEQFQSAL